MNEKGEQSRSSKVLEASINTWRNCGHTFFQSLSFSVIPMLYFGVRVYREGNVELLVSLSFLEVLNILFCKYKLKSLMEAFEMMK